MNSSMAPDSKRLKSLAFAGVSDARQFVERFHPLDQPTAKNHPDYALLQKLYAWMFMPLSLWQVDVKGLGFHVLAFIEAGFLLSPAFVKSTTAGGKALRRVDSQARLMAELLPEAPPRTVCDPVAHYEHAVKDGSYESLINAQVKFDSEEEALARNEEFKADWKRLKDQFSVDAYPNAKGVIRRRMVQERNFRPKDWKFSWGTEAERFQNVFDAFCHRWNLYGMEQENPLLLKLSVNLTPFSTMIEVPRYWSFDPKRDLKWGAVTKLHRMREVSRQGPKLSPILA